MGRVGYSAQKLHTPRADVMCCCCCPDIGSCKRSRNVLEKPKSERHKCSLVRLVMPRNFNGACCGLAGNGSKSRDSCCRAGSSSTASMMGATLSCATQQAEQHTDRLTALPGMAVLASLLVHKMLTLLPAQEMHIALLNDASTAEAKALHYPCAFGHTNMSKEHARANKG